MSDANATQSKLWWRHWSVVFILAILAGLVIWSLLNLGSWLEDLQEWRAARTVQKKLDQLYHKDNYGGATPEKTFTMFIAALENDDIELASKYFVIEKQEVWAKTLGVYKNRAFLADFIKELKSTPFDQDMFLLYPSGVWKINSL